MDPRRPARPRRPAGWIPLALAGALAAAAGACAEDDRAAAAGDAVVSPPAPPGCLVDRDLDGFGVGCPLGADCDDLDPSRATECGAAAEACKPGETEPCYRVLGATSETLSCAVGTRTCAESEVWGHCEVDDTYEIDNPGAALITGPEPCNPCNPTCCIATDLPEESDLRPGLNAEKVAFDGVAGGLVLSEDDDTGAGPGGPDADGDGVPDDYDLAPVDPLANGYVENGDRFYVLPFGGPTVVGEVNVDIVLRSADIYFLMDTTGSMQGEIDNLRTSLTQGNFLVDPAVCGLGEAAAPVRLADWDAQYFGNRSLNGAPVLTRVDAAIDFDWGGGKPDAAVPADNFSVRWSKTVNLPANTTFRFTMRTDDGMRVALDGVVKWSKWKDQGPTSYETSFVVPAGVHTIAIEYYERSGGAVAQAQAVGDAPAPPGYEGLIGALRCQIANPAFAIGYFDDYPIARYGYSFGDGACEDAATGTLHDVPFHQLAPSTLPTALATIQGAVDRLVAKCGDDTPESHLSALYSMATGAGLPDTRTGFYTSDGPVGFMDGSDPLRAPVDGTPTASPVGPNGLHVDFDAGDVTARGVVLKGDTTGEPSHHAGNCNASDTAPDHAVRFQIAARTRVVLSTRGSAYDTVITLYNGSGSRVGCDDKDGGTFEVSAVLDAGTYYAVVDGAGTDAGVYRLYVGPVAGDTLSTALDLGRLDGRFVELEGDTSSVAFTNFTGEVPCWGGDKDDSNDVVFRFTLDAPANVVVTNGGTTTNSVLQLYDGSFGFRYCHNGAGNQAGIFQRLEAGTHFVVWSGSSETNGYFRLGFGAWPDDTAWFTPPAADCPAGAFGAACFRPGTIPIAVVFTDAEMHNGDGGDDRYDGFNAPSYMDALTAMTAAGVKMVGIHSGGAAETDCSTPCTEYEQVYSCWDKSVCSETVSWQECWDETYCASYGDPVTTCSMKTYCQQGGICWEEEVCSTSTPCAVYDTRTKCRTRSSCVAYTTTTECGTKNGACIAWGPTTCEYEPEGSEADLRQLAIDTGSVNAEGEPFVYQINADGTGLTEAVVDAIAELSGSVRLDVTLRAHDDPTTPGVDERAFLKSIGTVTTGSPPPETSYRCLETFDTWYRKCLPGTHAGFRLGLQNDVVAPATEDQLFELVIDVMGDGRYVLGTFKVVVLVPETSITYPTEGRYWRDYDAYDFCPESQVPEWGNLYWDADVPAGTELEIQIRSALEADGLDDAEPARVLVPPATPPLHVSRTLREWGLYANAPNLRVTAVLRSDASRTGTPLLRGFDLRWNCVAAD